MGVAFVYNNLMLSVLACLVGMFAVLAVAEVLWRAKILVGEYQRKFVHILTTSFVAFWPWLISWRQIQLLGLMMLAIVALNHTRETLHFSADLRKKSLGGITLALAVIACASLTSNKIFFAVAMLNAALADGLAAVVGTRYGAKWEYRVFGYTKTVLGTMAFWITSLCVIGTGLLVGYTSISSQS